MDIENNDVKTPGIKGTLVLFEPGEPDPRSKRVILNDHADQKSGNTIICSISRKVDEHEIEEQSGPS